MQWSPDFDNKRYSWTEFASQQGYPTLAIDRLGNGQSSHPDPIATVQIPAQAATIHELVTLARAGGGPFPRCFESFIFVGSSMGKHISSISMLLAMEKSDIDINRLHRRQRSQCPLPHRLQRHDPHRLLQILGQRSTRLHSHRWSPPCLPRRPRTSLRPPTRISRS